MINKSIVVRYKEKKLINNNSWKYYLNYYKEYLRHNLKIYFIDFLNILILKEMGYYFFFYLNNSYFVKQKENEMNLLFINRKNFFTFLKNFFRLYWVLNRVFFFRIKLKGLGYVSKRYSKSLLSFFMAVSHYYYFHLPSNIYLKKKKRHFIFLSYNKVDLYDLFWNLIFLKKLNVYVRSKGLNGFIKPNFIRFIKKKYKL